MDKLNKEINEMLKKEAFKVCAWTPEAGKYAAYLFRRAPEKDYVRDDGTGVDAWIDEYTGEMVLCPEFKIWDLRHELASNNWQSDVWLTEA